MSDVQKRIGMRTATAMLALLVIGSSCERRQQAAADSSFGAVGLPRPPATDTPATIAHSGTAPELLYAVIAPEISEETPVIQRRLSTATGRPPFLRNDTLYAAAEDLVPILSPGARVSLSDRVVVVNGRKWPVTGLEQNGAIYVPVKAFARQLGAYTLISEADGSATIWPHDVLIYWKKHGPGNAPVLQEAAAEGLLPP
jgi:hypothetical protein